MTYKKYIKRGAALFLATVMLTGCKGGIPIVSDIKESRGYSLAETMIFVATERNKYQEVLTDQVWSVKLDDDGTTFQEYTLEQIKNFLQEMKTMTMLAKEKDISLTNAEQEAIAELSSEYYHSLTEEDIAYMKVKKEDIIHMYEEYYLANKLVNELTRDVDLEISDSEAKVITIQEIRVKDQETAQAACDKAQAEGADFAAVAREYSGENDIERQLGRGEEPGVVEDAAFSLTKDQVSGVIASENDFYVLKCISEYDEEATLERKKELSKERKNQAFRQIFDQFRAENSVVFSSDTWSEITFSPEDKTTTKNFFELYRICFPE